MGTRGELTGGLESEGGESGHGEAKLLTSDTSRARERVNGGIVVGF